MPRRGRAGLRAAAALATLALVVAVGQGCSYPRVIDEGRVDEAYLERLIGRTAAARGIALGDAPLRWELLTDEQQRARLRAAIAEVASDTEVQLTTWRAFGLVEPGFDAERLAELVLRQVAAHYDPRTKTFYLVERPRASGQARLASWLLERDLEQEFVVCHEVVHALQDRRHDLERFLEGAAGADAALARRAVVEGDATYFGLAALFAGVQGVDLDALEVDPAMLDDDLGDLEGAPPVVVEGLLFPYLGGLRLLQALGAAREQVWSRPPRSTEQVLHPEKYRADEPPVRVVLGAGAPPPGWSLVAEDTLGEALLRVLLRQAPDVHRAEADRGAAGWGGDAYRVYRGPGGALALAWALQFDTPADAREFVDLYRRRARALPPSLSSLCALHGPRGAVVVEAPSGEVLAAIAPVALLQEVPAPGDEAAAAAEGR